MKYLRLYESGCLTGLAPAILFLLFRKGLIYFIVSMFPIYLENYDSLGASWRTYKVHVAVMMLSIICGIVFGARRYKRVDTE